MLLDVPKRGLLKARNGRSTSAHFQKFPGEIRQVLGAFFSVFLIWVVTGVLVVLAILRMINKDYEIDSTVMAITATIGVCVNLM
ncbi:hypothetical protein ANCDUO_17074 [Ancylostoma duodenale]|uniref:Uncharacterized protein n=1 Tax=Ancylostoma duodenale TaxID=51022 RepID=A0A0C2CSP5_9BILA|nr:hypothetical protein ANCDUO_17074 [Ancylostoma duodenale]